MMGQEAVVHCGRTAANCCRRVDRSRRFSLIEGGRCRTSGYAIDRKSWIGRLEESILTGESEPVKKTEHVITENSIIGDQKNMVFSGTLCSKWVSYRCGSSNWRRDRNR